MTKPRPGPGVPGQPATSASSLSSCLYGSNGCRWIDDGLCFTCLFGNRDEQHR
ncbi:hypothetical protein C4K39_0869 [Pseudomonas sessilinigenes]|nr:hypothetical protein C4K39_0869 [Pseudomonas sessilinigenes]